MKGLNLPRYTSEECEKIFNNLKTGDKLVSITKDSFFGTRYCINVRKVVKRTPKGKIRLDNKKLIETLPYNNYPLNNDIEECIKKIETENKIKDLLYKSYREEKLISENLDYETALHLKDILEKLLKGVK